MVAIKKITARFWAKASIGWEHTCWIWRGSIDADGYGQFKLNGRCERAHRVAFAIWNGLAEVPRSLVLRHNCDTPPCCNPHHIIDGTVLDNVKDRVAKGRSAPGRERNERITHYGKRRRSGGRWLSSKES